MKQEYRQTSWRIYKMQKILRKRVLRDLKENFFRYLALGLLIILCMYMIGSLVGAGETIVQGVDEQAEKITWKMVSLPVLCRYQKIIKKCLQNTMWNWKRCFTWILPSRKRRFVYSKTRSKNQFGCTARGPFGRKRERNCVRETLCGGTSIYGRQSDYAWKIKLQGDRYCNDAGL